MSQLVDCVQISNNILRNIEKIENIPPLYIITSEVNTKITFDDIASVAKSVNIECKNINVSTIENLYATLNKLNTDDECKGIYINTLYESFIDKTINIYSLINPMKDVSAKNVISTGLINYNKNIIYPPYITIVLRILQELNVSYNGLPITIIDFYNEMSMSLAALLLNKGCNITICNQYTKNLRKYTKYNEVIISLIGKEYKFLSNSIKEQAIFIDLDLLNGGNNIESIKDGMSYYTDATGIKQLYITYILYNFIKLLQLDID